MVSLNQGNPVAVNHADAPCTREAARKRRVQAAGSLHKIQFLNSVMATPLLCLMQFFTASTFLSQLSSVFHEYRCRAL
jgi:hypothetical protein